jgi:ketosteroid isomerase-like protein
MRKESDPMPSTKLLGPATFLLAAALLGCGSGQPSRAAADTSQARDAAAASDLAAEERAIRDAESRWREVMRRKDTAAIGSFYTEDAIYAPEDRPPAEGRDAVAAMWSTFEFALDSVMLERTPLRIDVAASGDVATEVGTWVFRGTRRNEERVEGRGNYLTAWRKEAGDWKASAYLWNFGEGGRRAR